MSSKCQVFNGDWRNRKRCPNDTKAIRKQNNAPLAVCGIHARAANVSDHSYDFDPRALRPELLEAAAAIYDDAARGYVDTAAHYADQAAIASARAAQCRLRALWYRNETEGYQNPEKWLPIMPEPEESEVS